MHPRLRPLFALLLCVACLLLPAVAAAKQTFVMVHGATAGGWEWKRTGQFLVDAGHTVYRPTLTGLGERQHGAARGREAAPQRPRGGAVVGRYVGAAVAGLVGIVWILQGLDIKKGDGMSGHGIWAVLGALLVLLAAALVLGAVRSRREE